MVAHNGMVVIHEVGEAPPRVAWTSKVMMTDRYGEGEDTRADT